MPVTQINPYNVLAWMLIGFIGAGVVGGIVNRVTKINNDYSNNLSVSLNENQVIDDSRVSVTMKGSYNGKNTNLYVFIDHPDLSGTYVPYSWSGITLNQIDLSEYKNISKEGNIYTIELTDMFKELNIGYDTFTNFYKYGGSLGVIISYPTYDNFDLIQSDDLIIRESGNHYLSIPNDNKGYVSDIVVKYYKEDDKNNVSSNENSNSSDNESNSSEEESYHLSLVGTMNEWDISNDDYLLTYNSENNRYEIELNVESEQQFKIVKDNSYDWELSYQNVTDNDETLVKDTDGNITINLDTFSNCKVLISVDVDNYLVYVERIIEE